MPTTKTEFIPLALGVVSAGIGGAALMGPWGGIAGTFLFAACAMLVDATLTRIENS